MANPSAFPFTVTEHVIDGQYIREYHRATVHKVSSLKLAVKKYVPIENPNPRPGDVTIIAAPGGGFPKELYEPLWEDLLARSNKDGIRIGSIWIADAANLGASGVVNETLLGNDPSWLDHSRDLLCMVNQFRDEMPQPIIGVGHSMGAGQLALLSLMHPRLFTSLVLVEPVIVPKFHLGYGPLLSKLSLKRRDIWPSRSAAMTAARKTHKKWDSRVLEQWGLHGYRSLPTALYPQEGSHQGTQEDHDGPVTLTSTKHQEVMQYVRPNFAPTKDSFHDSLFHRDVIGPISKNMPFYRSEPIITWKLLDHVRPSVNYVFGGESPISTGEIRAELVTRTGTGVGGSGGLRNAQVQETCIKGSGHQLPLEKVPETASAIGAWVGPVVQRWREDEVRVAKGWEDLPIKERSIVSAEWMPNLETACQVYERKSRL